MNYCVGTPLFAVVKNFSATSDSVALLPVRTAHVTHLSPFTRYTFTVRAGNTLNDVILWGNWSNATSTVTDMTRKRRLQLEAMATVFST